MATPRKPQDRKPKAKPTEGSEPFSFEEDGKTYTLANPDDVLTAGFARKNRKLSADDQLWSIIEALADEETLDVIDAMPIPRMKELGADLLNHMGVTLGE